MTLMCCWWEMASSVTKKSDEFIFLTDVKLPKMFSYNPFPLPINFHVTSFLLIEISCVAKFDISDVFSLVKSSLRISDFTFRKHLFAL